MQTRNRIRSVAAGAVALSLAFSGVAMADNLQNDADVVGNGANQTKRETITAGGHVDVKYWIQDTANNGCDITRATVSISAPSGVTATPASLTFTGCGNATTGNQTVRFSSSVPSTGHAISHSLSDVAYNTGPNRSLNLNANFTLVVNPAPASADTTPPVINHMLNPASPDGSNGWYRSNVGLTWTVTENESPASLLKTGCIDQTITADQAEQTYSCSATSDGGSAGPVNVSIKRDATAPVISGTDVNNTTWRNTNLTESFTASDATSGLANAGDASFSLTASADSDDASTPTTVSRTVTDNAGNSSTRTLSALIDKTDPVNEVTGPADGAIYTLGSVPVPGCSTTDALSGAATQATPSTAGTLGSVTTTCSGGTDNAGNSAAPASVTYTVRHAFGGFQSPINPSATNRVQAGRAIPVKFTLNGDQGMGILSGTPRVPTMACGDTVDPIGADETVTAGSSSLQYDAATDTYTYVWKTDKAWAGQCRQLQVTLNDGTTHRAAFHFTR
jgi:hypothetical protein